MTDSGGGVNEAFQKDARTRATPLPEEVRGARKPRSVWRMFRGVLDHGGAGYLQFAITNLGNAKCDVCGFAVDKFDFRKRRSVTFAEARDAIDIAARNHIGYLLFVGGEPLIHRDLLKMVAYAARIGIHPMICTNGSLWTEENIREFIDAGLSSVIMSIDAHEVAAHEKNRRRTGVCRKIKEANAVFAKHQIQSTASVTASRLIENYDKLPAFLQSLGFSACTFSYPLTHLESSYLSFSNSKLVSYSVDALLGVFERIKRLKKRARCRSSIRRHRSTTCSGASNGSRDGCTRCMIDCYRDPGVLQHLAVNLSDAYHHAKNGRLVQAANLNISWQISRRSIADR